MLLVAPCLAPATQGHELHYATNFLGHFALTQQLLPALLDARARVVVVSSILHTYVDDASEQEGGTCVCACLRCIRQQHTHRR